MISVTKVKVSKDLHFARVYVSLLNSKNKKNYAFHVKVQRVEQIKYERKIFDAYKNGTLMKFINKNKDKLINYKK